jgi:ubiquinone/menaquinone biosynthesis C-methylase UbiE
VTEGPGVDIVADAHNLPFDDNEFEVILCTEVLEHLKSPEIAIKEMKRVLKPSGKLILTTRFIFPLHDVPGDYWRFTKYGLEHLFADWQIEEFKEEATTLETMGVLMQRIAFQCNFKYRFLENVFHLTARLFTKLNFLIVRQYGSKGKKAKQAEKQILSSGYYLVCRNVK